MQGGIKPNSEPTERHLSNKDLSDVWRYARMMEEEKNKRKVEKKEYNKFRNRLKRLINNIGNLVKKLKSVLPIILRQPRVK